MNSQSKQPSCLHHNRSFSRLSSTAASLSPPQSPDSLWAWMSMEFSRSPTPSPCPRTRTLRTLRVNGIAYLHIVEDKSQAHDELFVVVLPITNFLRFFHGFFYVTGSQYQLQMMHCLREVNVDDNSVGWYQSTNMGNFMNQSLIEHQFEFQQALNKSVLIIHGKDIFRGHRRSHTNHGKH